MYVQYLQSTCKWIEYKKLGKKPEAAVIPATLVPISQLGNSTTITPAAETPATKTPAAKAAAEEKAEADRLAAAAQEKAEADRLAAAAEEKAEADRLAAAAEEKAETSAAEPSRKRIRIESALDSLVSVAVDGIGIPLDPQPEGLLESDRQHVYIAKSKIHGYGMYTIHTCTRVYILYTCTYARMQTGVFAAHDIEPVADYSQAEDKDVICYYTGYSHSLPHSLAHSLTHSLPQALL